MSIRSTTVEVIAGFPKAVKPDVAASVCTKLVISESEFCDVFAKDVVRGYKERDFSWSEADAAMNALSGFFFGDLPPRAPFPEYAFGVFLAFDAGELHGEPDNERITNELLDSLHVKPN